MTDNRLSRMYSLYYRRRGDKRYHRIGYACVYKSAVSQLFNSETPGGYTDSLSRIVELDYRVVRDETIETIYQNRQNFLILRGPAVHALRR